MTALLFSAHFEIRNEKFRCALWARIKKRGLGHSPIQNHLRSRYLNF